MLGTHAHHIDAVLLDLTLSDISGDEVFREIRTIRPDVKVILPSGVHRARDHKRTFQDDGLAGFIPKPCQAVELVDKVCDVLSRARA